VIGLVFNAILKLLTDRYNDFVRARETQDVSKRALAAQPCEPGHVFLRSPQRCPGHLVLGASRVAEWRMSIRSDGSWGDGFYSQVIR
jgi:hypothetical protein